VDAQRRWTVRLLAISVVLGAGGTEQLTVMAQEPAKKATTVDVGFDLGKAGDTVSLPIELNAPEGVAVGATINEVTFPTKWFRFEEVRRPPSADVEVKAAVKEDDKEGGNAIVQVTVTAKQGTALPIGIIASLVFKIADEARESQVFKLRNVARALSTNVPPAPIEAVTGKDGQIELLGSAPAVIACFFYMH
jgi:hypothetical protein